jgi:hypothetical protein
MIKQGLIQKMHSKLDKNLVQYTLPIGDELLGMNALIGKKISLEFNGKIICAHCGNTTKKSYSQGFCFPCCQALAKCDLCIMKPETCHHHLGTCREPLWGLDNCFSPHIVYLANSSGIKVGITRAGNIPHRWIDQGAVEVLPILEVPTRLQSGKFEIQLKAFVADKTNWRKMLKNDIENIDLIEKKSELLAKINTEGAKILNAEPLKIIYPVHVYPSKIISLNFDKTPLIQGVLQGVKGQYLLFDTGVLNIRKFSAYNITLTY